MLGVSSPPPQYTKIVDFEALPEKPESDQLDDFTLRKPQNSRNIYKTLLLCLLIVVVLTLFFGFLPLIRLLYTLKYPPVTRVGHRSFQPQYYGQGCTSTQLLESLAKSKIKPYGLSRIIDRTSNFSSLSIPEFTYSFELEGCPPPHVFDSEEACDLVTAFGGVFLKGDSLIRHVQTALMMLLRDRLDGALRDAEMNLENCHYEGMFYDGRKCYMHHQPSSQDTTDPVCAGEAYVYYDFASKEVDNSMVNFASWTSMIPYPNHNRSPVFIQSVGLHMNCSVPAALSFVKGTISYLSTVHVPRAISLWMGLHAPGLNKAVKYIPTQGREAVKKLNEGVQKELEAIGQGEIIDGATKSMEWFNATDGAESFDGTHYSYQVNMEKAQILLNVLDLLWGETVARGGLVGDPVMERTG